MTTDQTDAREPIYTVDDSDIPPLQMAGPEFRAAVLKAESEGTDSLLALIAKVDQNARAWGMAHARALDRAKIEEAVEPEAAAECDYEGHVIGEDGLVAGPGGQRLKPVVDPWPEINARRQAEGSA